MSSIYKVCIFNETGKIRQICLFCGDQPKTPDTYFSKTDWKQIESNSIEVVCIPLYIHSDDSIHTVKMKIVKCLLEEEEIPFKCSYEEMYLFGIVDNHPFSLPSFYRNITENDTYTLPLSLLSQSLVNYTGFHDSEIDEKIHSIYKKHPTDTVFSYEDLTNMEWFVSEKQKKRKIPIGVRFYDRLDESFIVNPLDVWDKSHILHKKKNQLFDNEFLFRSGNLKDNCIYLVLAEDVLKKKGEDILPIYFPLLAEKNILSYETLLQQKQYLLSESRKKCLSKELNLHFKKIDLLYRIYDSRKNELEYEERGIHDFHFIVHPEEKTQKMPLETIFKNIHVTKQIPFIQFNPGIRQENSYRVYTIETAKNGKQIPFLSQLIISQLAKRTSRQSNISVYVSKEEKLLSIKDLILITFHNNGDIHIQGTLPTPMMPDMFNDYIIRICAPALSMVNLFLEKSGYYIRPFTNMNEPFVELLSANYKCKLNIKTLQMKKWMGCISSFFQPEVMETKQSGIELRYIRVENFKKMSIQDEFIANLLRFTQDSKFIHMQLKKEFPMDNAEQLMNEYSRSHVNTTVPGRYINRKIEILENSGFKTTFHRLNETSCEVIVENIDLLQYLYVLPVYIDSVLRLNAEKKISEDIQSLCIHTSLKWQNEYDAFQKPMIKNSISIFEEGEKPILLPTEEEEEVVLDLNDYDIDMYGEEDEEVDEEEDEEELEKEKESESEKESEKESEDESQRGGGKQDDSEDEEEEEEESDEEEDDIQDELKENGNEKKRVSTYWKNRIKDRDPILFKLINKGFTRLNQSEQPVVLTESEIEQIDPKMYNHKLKYRASRNEKPLYYICPRYWCTHSGMEKPLSEEEAKNPNICGKIIKDRSDIKPGEYVIEYSGQNPEPGFVKTKKKDIQDEKGNPICFPKCFKKWDVKSMVSSRGKCAPEYYKIKEDKPKVPTTAPTDVYIKESNNFPLDKGRIGKLPIPIQSFLYTNNESCIENRKIKMDCPVLLRYGPEPTPQGKQSFLSSLCDIYSYEKEKKQPFTLSQFRDIIVKSISLDLYVQLHNSSLVTLFQKRDEEDVDWTEYEKTDFYKTIHFSEKAQVSFFKDTISSYHQFQHYLRDETITIDYEYLWEIVSRPNPHLFEKGLNLLILEMPEHDNTNNVILLCPPNSYSYPLYDMKRKTVIMIKQTNETGTYFEPVYRYRRRLINKKEVEDVQKQFSEKSKGLENIMVMIQKLVTSNCKPKKPRVYEFQHNRTADEMYDYIKTKMENLHIESRVINYQGKTIGFLIEWKKKPIDLANDLFFLPCYPSSLQVSLKTLWIDDPNLWTDYHSTVTFLKYVYEKSDLFIPCKPVFRVVDKQKIIGILTSTNQFVQLNEPIDDYTMGDSLISLKSSNYIQSDKKIQMKNVHAEVPQEKEIQYILLESKFYSVFRSTIRILLNLFRNRVGYQQIMRIHKSRLFLKEKRKQVVEVLKRLAFSSISFHHFTQKVLLSLDELYSCNADCKNRKYCMMKDKECVLLVPDKNLVNGTSNEILYYERLADELLRNKRIHLMMFYPDSYLNISNTEFIIHPDEMLITDVELKNNYFEGLEPFSLQKYARKTTYETSTADVRPYHSKVDWIQEYEEADIALQK